MDPLSQLKDIHLPEPVSQYPLAYGWWLLLALLIIVFAFITRQWLQARRFNRAKKQALNQLGDAKLTASDILCLLKWCCLQYFPRQALANIHGQAFADFLVARLPEKLQQAEFVDCITQALLSQYQAPNAQVELQDNQALAEATASWINAAITAKNVRSYQATTQATVQYGDHASEVQ